MLAGLTGCDGADPVDMPLYEVAAEPVLQPYGPFQIDAGSRLERAQAGPLKGLPHDIGGEGAVREIYHGQADAVDRDGRAMCRVLGDERAADRVAGRVRVRLDGHDLAELLDDSGEHPGASF